MSETKVFTGVISKVDFYSDRNLADIPDLEEKCKIILKQNNISKYFDTWEETFREHFWDQNSYIILGRDIYKVEEKIDQSYQNICLVQPSKGKLKFVVKYWDGGSDFSESLEHALGVNK